MSWLDDIKVCSEVFAFQNNLYCADCAREISAELDAASRPNDGDSRHYPQGPYVEGAGQTDDPHFCASGKNCLNTVRVGNRTIGCPLGNHLTRDGAESLVKSILDLALGSRDYERRLSRLYLKVWTGEVDHYRIEWLRRVPAKFERSLPASLERRVEQLRGVPSQIMYQDENHVYVTTRRDGLVDLIRCTISYDGTFPSSDVATVPGSVADSIGSEKLIRDAIDEGAWD